MTSLLDAQAAKQAPRRFLAEPALTALLAAVRPMVAMTYDEAREKDHHGMRFMYCQCDVLNACWDNRPDDVPGKHWGGGDACPECNLRAAIAGATNASGERESVEAAAEPAIRRDGRNAEGADAASALRESAS